MKIKEIIKNCKLVIAVPVLILICVLVYILTRNMVGPGKEAVLTVSDSSWADGGSGSSASDELKVRAGDVVFEGWVGKLTVMRVSEDKIVLRSRELVETEENGGIDLHKMPPPIIVLHNGESIDLASQTMDAGVHVHLEYNVRPL